MANIKTILDIRRAKSDGTFNVIFRITHLRKVYTLNSGISISLLYWDNNTRTISKQHPNAKYLNLKLSKEFFKIQQALLLLDDDFTIEKFRKMINGETEKALIKFKEFAHELIKQMFEANKTGNALVYQTAVNKLISFCGNDITFKGIDYKCLTDFQHHLVMSGLKQNSISNYFRTIRAIYNKAIKQKIIDRSSYPFYDISVKTEKTAKRAILKEDILKLLLVHLEEQSTAKRSLDYFMLSFYLRGISFTDLAYLKTSNIIDDRIHYKRRKTHKNYSVKLFSQSVDVLKLYTVKDSVYLLPIISADVPEDSIKAKRIIHQWIKTTNKYLKRLSNEAELSSSVTTYTSRHSFATIAKRLGYSNELIAEALGHQYGNRVTNTYLDVFDTNVLDAMHYQVISL